MFDCISLTLLGPSDRLQAHSWASNSSPCSSVYFRASSTFAPLRGNPYLANPAHKRFHSWASLGRRPLLRVDDLFLSSLHPSRRPGACCRLVLQGCRMWLFWVSLMWETHGCVRTKAHFFVKQPQPWCPVFFTDRRLWGAQYGRSRFTALQRGKLL